MGRKVKKLNKELLKQFLTNMNHSRRPLNNSAIQLFDKLPETDEKYKLADKYMGIVNSLAEMSRHWAANIHWLFTVCSPRITDQDNPQYSPIYEKYACDLPKDQFYELSTEDLVTDRKHPKGFLEPHSNKLVGDKRYAGYSNFGTAWNQKGEVIKTDSRGHPVLDGFALYVYNHVDAVVKSCLTNRHRDRHVQAFMIAHTRDLKMDTLTSIPQHKEAHFHIVLDLPAMKSRYQIMQALGVNFQDYVETFSWIAQSSSGADLEKRMDVFFDSLIGMIKNYTIPEHYQAALRYLVHQSKKALEDQKATYKTSEVFYWLPDEPGATYETIAGVYDNEIVVRGIEADILANSHSPFNTAHQTFKKFVGKDKAFSYKLLKQLRKQGKKRPGNTEFSLHSRTAIMNQLMTWIREGKIEFADWQILLHAAFDDSDVDALLSDANFVRRMEAVLESEKQAILSDPTVSRNMLTYCIFASQGGIGKTRLANAMALIMDKNRKPFQVVTKNRHITFDPFQNYESETSVIMDELGPASLGWPQIKDCLDPYKIPYVGSRFHNTSPWNVKQTFITNVFAYGISDFATGVLKYAEGVSTLGYLRKTGAQWELITNDVEAGEHYIAQLSQLLRRLPFVINLAPTENGLGTIIKVSTINFQPGNGHVSHFDYVHTQDSTHVFRTVINENLSEQDMTKIARQVIKMVQKLRVTAQAAFRHHPGKLLDELDGFVADHCDFLLRYQPNGQPYLINPESNDEFSQIFDDEQPVKPQFNLISRLQKTEVVVWPGKAKKGHVNPDIDQLEALFDGYEVPISKSGYDTIETIKLTDKAKKLIQSCHQQPIWEWLNLHDQATESNSLLTVQTNETIADFKLKDNNK